MGTVGRLWVAIGVVAVGLSIGCSPLRLTPTPPLAVQAPSFAMAELLRRVGLGRVAVSDHGPTIDVGTHPWLDLVAMEDLPAQVATLLARKDPLGRSAYDTAARAYRAQLEALEIDYRSSLADCGRHDIVTADTAFAPMAARYNFVDLGAGDPRVAAIVRTAGIPVVFTEPGVTSSAVTALARATHTRVDELDTLVTRTPAEAARGATYLSLMTDNLAKLRTALACGSS